MKVLFLHDYDFRARIGGAEITLRMAYDRPPPGVATDYCVKFTCLDGRQLGFEVFLDTLPPEKRKSRAKAPLAQSDLLPVTRDFAFVLDQAVNAGDVIKAALGADQALISSVSVFDVFEGGALAAEGKKSVAIEVTLQPGSETLTDKDIEAISQKVIADVKKATGGEIRG